MGMLTVFARQLGTGPEKSSSVELIFSLRRSFRSRAQELHDAYPGGISGAASEELGGGFDYSDFFRNRCCNPLIQRHSVFLR